MLCAFQCIRNYKKLITLKLVFKFIRTLIHIHLITFENSPDRNLDIPAVVLGDQRDHWCKVRGLTEDINTIAVWIKVAQV